MGDNRPPYEDGAPRGLPWHNELQEPSQSVPPADNQALRAAKQYCIGQRVTVYLRLLETSNGSTRDITEPQHSVPPTDG